VQAIQTILRIGRPAVAGIALFLIASPALAVTCEEVAGLGPVELKTWALRLQVSPAQLRELLERAFCDAAARPGRVVSSGADRAGPVTGTQSR